MEPRTEREILLMLGVMNEKLDEIKSDFKQHLQDDAKVEQRLRYVERRQSWFMGGLASIPVIGAAIAWMKGIF